jgi:hypothetical protein
MWDVAAGLWCTCAARSKYGSSKSYILGCRTLCLDRPWIMVLHQSQPLKLYGPLVINPVLMSDSWGLLWPRCCHAHS